MATDIPLIHKWWQQPSPNNDYRPLFPQPWPCELRNSLFIAMQCKRFVCNTQTQAHGWLDGRTNAWNDNNTHRHQCWPRVSHLETSAFLTLCHSFPVTCQQMCKNLKMWLTDLLTDKWTDRRTDKRVAGGHYCLRDWSRSGGSYGNNTRVICCPAPGRPRRTTNHEGVVAVTPDRPWSIPIITWLNNVVWNVFTTKYAQNHHQI